jgi:mRNA-degrading endonuclease RelE of RelBE toxin-antitoxin system
MNKKVVKKLSKSCQKVVKKFVKKMSKSCQKVVKKLSKSCQKDVKKLSKTCQKVVKFDKKFDPTFAPPEPNGRRSREQNYPKTVKLFKIAEIAEN